MHYLKIQEYNDGRKQKEESRDAQKNDLCGCPVGSDQALNVSRQCPQVQDPQEPSRSNADRYFFPVEDEGDRDGGKNQKETFF